MDQLERWHLDRQLFYALCALSVLSMIVLYSASAEDGGMLLRHALRLAGGMAVMIMIAQLRPETLARWSVYIFGAAVVLLLAVLLFGTISKGARRWLDLGLFRIQPSEIMKLGMPMMLAWYFSRRSLPPTLTQVGVALLLAVLPTALIIKQPDLGTAILVLASGVFVLFLAGMNWRIIAGMAATAAAVLPYAWNHLHDYQRQRILTLIDPSADPLGAGYHTLQGMIAVGSGGFFGKGWLNSSQAHLSYLPESSTDFIFAVFAEEFGLIGITLLLGLYLYIVARGLMIAFYAQDSYNRLLAGSISLTFFLYLFVNVGMVTGILPVVGVPMPLLSYGGTATVTLMAGFGILMSIQTHRKLVGN